jgi:O-antigen ligase
MAVIEHPDMPKSLFDIQGLNPWNILLLIIILAWLAQRGKEHLQWDMPGKINGLLIIYTLVILVAFSRMIGDLSGYQALLHLRGIPFPSTGNLVSEHIINAFKWVIPGLLLYDGCRDPKRLRMGMFTLLLVYFLLAVQVIKWMPLSNITGGEELSERSLKILMNEIGYHRVNLSMMLAGASWAVFASREFIGGQRVRWMILGSVIIFFAQMLTGGRMGYVTWAVVGLILLWSRWRRYLLLAPIVVAGILSLVPGAWERMSQGFGQEEPAQESSRLEKMSYEQSDGPDTYSITSGRNIAWPLVINKIKESPWIGYGKEAMVQTGLAGYLLTEYGELFPHPHNAYLQLLLDNGIFGALGILLFYILITKYSYSLFRDSRSPEFIAAGGCCLALLLALLVASMGSQTFYPREGAVGMWCAIGLMLRVYVQRNNLPHSTYKSSVKIEDTLLWKRPNE